MANPKSSIGRLDVFVRVVTEYAMCFDEIPRNYAGRLYLEISPRSFPIIVKQGACLTQLRLFRNETQNGLTLDDKALQELHDKTPLYFLEQNDILAQPTKQIKDGLALTVNLEPAKSKAPIGYRAKRDYADVVIWQSPLIIK